ncbi:MAG: hypothetical protein HOC22_05880 [Cryomorphaceae bacterium]|jgi:hypothetical protein|nr:hypothetical protein [Cryomorphaceae bacterium]MBT3503884.1 hypothetical protein [Cryomorphaceae bacterium]MBT3689078.1 hypothetical protein [Cryomorphaceae bacterium]MBT4222311.1 hypothetical protein [Cryomorphaceae bacterium]MBT4293028.1 hypothetical protein [Cryomorphaceae bacterium]
MKKLLFLFLLISFYTFSQTNNQKFIEGIVYNDNSYSIQGVHVLNITSNEATITDSEGNFKILVNLNDELIFSAIQFKRNKIIIDKDVFDSLSITIYLEEFVNELDEVILNSSGLSGSLMNDLKNSGIVDNINFDDLGIPGFTGIRKEDIPSNSQLTKELLLAPLAGGLDVERMFNWISGYYKEKRKEREFKNDYNLIDRIINFYGLRFFIDEFGLIEDNIHEFVTSAYQNYPLEENFKAGNYTLLIDYFKKNFKRLNY